MACLAASTPLSISDNSAKNVPADDISTVSFDEEDNVSTCMFTTLEISVNDTDGAYVKAVLENSFTFLPSTVCVDLWLYSSLTKTTDRNKMTLEGRTHSDDLNVGEYITVTASTHNEDRYWVAYAIYYKSSTNTQTYQTEPKFFYADGTYNPTF